MKGRKWDLLAGEMGDKVTASDTACAPELSPDHIHDWRGVGLCSNPKTLSKCMEMRV
jgi:hypothetical protein